MAGPTPEDVTSVFHDLARGTRLGRYVVQDWLAAGAMGVIYLAEHEVTHAPVAIKVMQSRYARVGEARARFEREATVLARLSSSPHVVQIHDVGELSDGRQWLATEFIGGMNLAAVLENAADRDERITVERVCRVIRDVTAAAQEAHGRKIVHRDIKPSNVLLHRALDGTETAKVIDFGLSADLVTSTEPDERLTRVGVALGTEGYMPPEVRAGLPPAPSHDVFSIGVLACELLSGRRPGEDAVTSGTLEGVFGARSDVPEALASVLRRCLDWNPTKRPTTRELLRVVDAVLDELRGEGVAARRWAADRPFHVAGELEVEPGRSDAPPPPRYRRRPLAVGLAVLGVVLIGIWVVVAALTSPPVDETSVAEIEPEMHQPSTPDPVDPPHAVAPAVAVEAPAVASDDADEPEAPEPAEPSPAPVATPERPNPSVGSPKPKPSPPSADSTSRCALARAQASTARTSKSWSRVLEHTRDATCWPDAEERRLLRVQALASLERFDACAREARGSSNPTLVRLFKMCSSQLSTEDRP